MKPRLLIVQLSAISAAFLVLAAGKRALAADLSDQFYVPKSGHIVLELSWPRTVLGLQVKTVDDVLKLREALSAAPLDDVSIKSFAHLKAVGGEIPPLSSIPVPPGLKVINDRPPEWQTYELHLDGDSLRQVLKGSRGDRVFVHTSDSDVVLSNSVSSGQVTHGLSGALKNRKFDLLTLFTRSTRRYAQDGWHQAAASPQRRFSRAKGANSGWIIAAPDSDNILVSAIERNGSVSSFVLHLRPRRFEVPKSYFVPSLTCEFHKTQQSWRMVSYLMQTLELDVPVDKENFKVPLVKDNIYVAQTSRDARPTSAKIVEPMNDIAALTPTVVAKTIRAQAMQRNRRPGISLIVYCMGILFLLAAGMWAYRAFPLPFRSSH